ncbi:schlafen-like protein 1 isoform X1 [Branchiostoma lanceolatum]|uniref:schlafen-like protein 1 isoform X1 n=1 Tax=Branchiostoma lanceolatum TaxID=7740 RepID=UPI0034553981
MSESHGVFVGNLNPSRGKEDLRHGLTCLLTSLGFSAVTEDDVEVKKKHRRAFGFIYFQCAEEQNHALSNLLSLSEDSLILISQLQIVAENKRLKINLKNDDHGEHRMEMGKRRKQVRNMEQHQMAAHESVTNHHSSNARCNSRPPDLLDFSKVPNETQRTDWPANRSSENWLLGESIGTETRSLEFKKGDGNFLDVHLKKTVAKYICAFLNSDGGTLMVGVTDDGQVCGVSCDHRREDNVRIDIDSVIKGFRPQVFPSQYSVKFTPVLEQSIHGDAPTNRKVLSITVHTPTDRHQGLYATPHGEVFVRRDGSVEELSASGVQEWCRRNYQKDLQVLQDRERQLLRELQDKEHREQQRLKEQQDKDVSSQNYLQDLHVLQDREQQLLQELQDKEHRLKEVEKKLSSKSKVCVIL